MDLLPKEESMALSCECFAYYSDYSLGEWVMNKMDRKLELWTIPKRRKIVCNKKCNKRIREEEY